MILLGLVFLGSINPTAVVGATNCSLSKVQIAAGTETAKTQQVIVTATPSCWSGSVMINRGNVDTNLITVTVRNGVGSGLVAKIDTTQEVHPYSTNPGMRGNNIVIPCFCSGTGLTRLLLTVSRNTLTVTAMPSTWAGTVNIVSLTGKILTQVNVPSSPGHVTIRVADSETVRAIYSGIISNSVTIA
jgi:hypothetical protein